MHVSNWIRRLYKSIYYVATTDQWQEFKDILGFILTAYMLRIGSILKVMH